MENRVIESVVIRFAGDSGDGMQLMGNLFSNSSAIAGNDISTFPDFPAEIRAPAGSAAGVSGFQLHFGSVKIFTPGELYDALVVMNAAALSTNIKNLKKGGLLIANTAGFDSKNLRLAGKNSNPLDDGSLTDYDVKQIDILKLTKDALEGYGFSNKEIDRSKNMFALGILCWVFERPLEPIIKYIEVKFRNKEVLADANKKLFQAGFHFGETTEIFQSQYKVKPAELPPGTYRHITGNQALAYGLIAGSEKSGLPLFLGSYPITPASDILHELAKYKNFNIRTFQAEDEIAGICAAIGASYGGHLGITTSSGPGIALKTEAIGLAIMLELPLVICNIQRGGPSTGLPTKTEQADLLQAVYGRNGEAPMPVLAASSPSDCFRMAFEAVRIALEHMTPVMLLSDGYLANGAEPWRFPVASDIPEINSKITKKPNSENGFMPYLRDEKLVRDWAVPGTKGLEHRIGGLEKEDITGNVSYDTENHEKMVKIRAAKVEAIATEIPLATIDSGCDDGDVLVIGWGSTYGAIHTGVALSCKSGIKAAHLHLHYINPLPVNLNSILGRYRKVLVPEMNNGQLIKIIRDKFLVNAKGLNKIQGKPFSEYEIVEAIKELHN